MSDGGHRHAMDKHRAVERATAGICRVTSEEPNRFAVVEELIASGELRLIGRGYEATRATSKRPSRERAFIEYGPNEDRI